ncbi:MAG: hypothetical protein HZR80_18195 [Candidatus Heimdallarchaeota archaeon]
MAVICSRLGLKTVFSGKIGRDDFGYRLFADLYRESAHRKDSSLFRITEHWLMLYLCR